MAMSSILPTIIDVKGGCSLLTKFTTNDLKKICEDVLSPLNVTRKSPDANFIEIKNALEVSVIKSGNNHLSFI
jgi:hypothetical protein